MVCCGVASIREASHASPHHRCGCYPRRRIFDRSGPGMAVDSPPSRGVWLRGFSGGGFPGWTNAIDIRGEGADLEIER